MRNSRLKKDDLVIKARRLLKDLRAIINQKGDIPLSNVQKVNKMTHDMVIPITSQEN